jgi:hypothetical protein
MQTYSLIWMYNLLQALQPRRGDTDVIVVEFHSLLEAYNRKLDAATGGAALGGAVHGSSVESVGDEVSIDINLTSSPAQIEYVAS